MSRKQRTLLYRLQIANDILIVVQSANYREDADSYGHVVERTPARDHSGWVSTSTKGTIMPTAWEYV